MQPLLFFCPFPFIWWISHSFVCDYVYDVIFFLLLFSVLIVTMSVSVWAIFISRSMAPKQYTMDVIEKLVLKGNKWKGLERPSYFSSLLLIFSGCSRHVYAHTHTSRKHRYKWQKMCNTKIKIINFIFKSDAVVAKTTNEAFLPISFGYFLHYFIFNFCRFCFRFNFFSFFFSFSILLFSRRKLKVMNGMGQSTWLCNLFMCNKLKKEKMNKSWTNSFFSRLRINIYAIFFSCLIFSPLKLFT